MEEGYPEEDVMRSIYAKSRDNARTPMQWSKEKNAGFTDGTPWIAVNPNYVEINAEEERKDPDSVYCFYRALTHLRKEYPVFVDGKFELLLPEDEQIFAYTRTDEDMELLVCANFTKDPAACTLEDKWRDAAVLLHNYKEDPGQVLKPYETVILIRRRDH